MIVHELVGGHESDPAHRKLDTENRARQLDFLKSLVNVAIQVQTRFLPQTVIKALNFHAIGCLHAYAGQYRPADVRVGEYVPPQHFRVASLMDDMVNRVNRHWTEADPLRMATYVLWRTNWIHPFVNGNGRTARAASYFVVCLHAGFWIGGDPVFPDRLKGHPEYIPVLRTADRTGDLLPLEMLIGRLLIEQTGRPSE